MKTLILGTGFLASHFKYPKLNIKHLSFQDILTQVSKHSPDIIVNAIGFGGSVNIDGCETDKLRTIKANVEVALQIAEVCDILKIRLIHFSSGCIVSGRSPHYTYGVFGGAEPNHKVRKEYDAGWKEEDAPNPQSFYSKTKAASDLIIGSLPFATCLRIRMPISPKNHPRNLLSKLIGYKQVVETNNSVSFTGDIVRAVEWVIEKEKLGVFNLVHPTSITHSVLLEEYKKYFPNHQYEKISVGELDKLTVAPRSNCILNTEKIQKEGFRFTPIDTLIREYVGDYVRQLNKE